MPPARDDLAAAFAHAGVAGAYRHRPPYPPEVFDVLGRLITDRPRTVLDIGAGEGALARPLAALADHVDAVDISAAMVEAGRRRPGGRRANLRWILGAAESAELDGPYALVTAGASLHWMPWVQTLSRLASVMTGRAFLAIVEHGYHEVPWRAELTEVIVRHSRSAVASAASLVTTAPPRTSEWPETDLVSEYTDAAAPKSSGFCSSPVATVLSTTNGAPAAAARDARAVRSATRSSGFVGVSAQSTAGPARSAPATASRSSRSTATARAPCGRSRPASARVL